MLMHLNSWSQAGNTIQELFRPEDYWVDTGPQRVQLEDYTRGLQPFHCEPSSLLPACGQLPQAALNNTALTPFLPHLSKCELK